MATLKDEIRAVISGHCMSEILADHAAEKVAKLVEEKFTSTNSASLKLRVLVELLKSRPLIDTTCVLKVLYDEFPQLQA